MRQLEVHFRNILIWLLMPIICLTVAITEWMHWYRPESNSPGFATALTIALAVVAFFKIRTLLREAEYNYVGLMGERYVAELLDELKANGFRVIHDVPGKGFNVDHVVVGPTGVYAIETKTRKKWSNRRNVTVKYDGQRVLVDGYTPDRDPVAQARANADHIADLVKKHGNDRPFVRPVVAFPGWYVERQPPDVLVWVLNAKALITWIGSHRDSKLAPETITRIAAAIDQHARNN